MSAATRPTLEALWLGYEQAVVPPDAGAAQRFDTRQAFIAGAHSIFSMLTGPMTKLSDDQACVMLSHLQREFDQNLALLRAKAEGAPT